MDHSSSRSKIDTIKWCQPTGYRLHLFLTITHVCNIAIMLVNKGGHSALFVRKSASFSFCPPFTQADVGRAEPCVGGNKGGHSALFRENGGGYDTLFTRKSVMSPFLLFYPLLQGQHREGGEGEQGERPDDDYGASSWGRRARK
jgi:hypothetical protein